MEVEQKVMSRSDAERLTERIRHTANTFVDAKEKLSRFIQEAQEGRAHEALGFRSWTEYVAQVFSDTPLMRLSRDERRELVGKMSESGMSTRAIAPIVGASNFTVSKDREAVRDLTPAPRDTFEVHSGSGFAGPGEEIEMHTTTTYDRESGEVVDERPYGEPSRVIGMDGKTYTRTEPAPDEPSKPKRSPLPQQFLNATVELRKCVERVERLVNDDRFPRNKNEIASLYESDLTRAVDSLNKSIAAFH
jgi:hypothetical protein